MSKDNLIVAQCCFKGAIDLAVANKITVEEINDMTATFTEAILGKYGNGMVTQVETPAKPVFQPKKNYNNANSGKPKIGNPNEDASEKQLSFIKSLIKEVPASEQDAFNQLLNGKVTKGIASGMIEQLKQKVDENVPPVAKTDTAKDVAPF